MFLSFILVRMNKQQTPTEHLLLLLSSQGFLIVQLNLWVYYTDLDEELHTEKHW